MKKFKVSFVNSSGKISDEILTLDNENKIAEYAAANNLFVRKVYDISQSYQIDKNVEATTSAKNLMLFTWQLAVMLDSGSIILESLKLIAKQMTDKNFQFIILNMAAQIENGKLFSDAIAAYPKIFSSAYVAAVKSGEKSGELPAVLTHLSDFIDKREALKNKLKTILTYPAVLLSVAVFGIAFLLIYVLPKFVGIFSTLGIKSASVDVIVTLTYFLETYALPLFVVLIIIIIITFIIFKTINKPQYFDFLKIKIPFVGSLISKVNISIFANTLQILLDSGNSVVESVKISAQAVPNKYISMKILSIIPAIENGEPLHKAFEKSGQFADIALHMIFVGERSGTLSDMLQKVNLFYSREVEFTVTETLAIIEPLILVILGLIVCLIAMSIFLPINDFISSLHRR